MTDDLRKYFAEPGQRFERLVVLRETRVPKPNRPNGKGQLAVVCQCDCGNRPVVLLTNFCRGASKSCGCLDIEVATERMRQLTNNQAKHGLSYHPFYKMWYGMIERCEHPGHKSYARYGGRGIAICARWHDVQLFIADIERLLGQRPPGMSIDRINNDGNYEPGNVRWATASEQGLNRAPRPVRWRPQKKAEHTLTVVGW